MTICHAVVEVSPNFIGDWKIPSDSFVLLLPLVNQPYDLNGCAVADIKGRLRDAANHLADEGLLSGDTNAVVTEWNGQVEEPAVKAIRDGELFGTAKTTIRQVLEAPQNRRKALSR